MIYILNNVPIKKFMGLCITYKTTIIPLFFKINFYIFLQNESPGKFLLEKDLEISLFEGHFGCSLVWEIINKTAINISIQVFV